MSETVDGGIYWDARSFDLIHCNRNGVAGEDVAFFIEQARRYGERVLELGCGTGRVTIPLAEQGIEVVRS